MIKSPETSKWLWGIIQKIYIIKDTHERVSETLLKGGVFKVEGSDSEDEKFNENIQDIQKNQQLTLEQRRLKVEAEVNFMNKYF